MHITPATGKSPATSSPALILTCSVLILNISEIFRAKLVKPNLSDTIPSNWGAMDAPVSPPAAISA